MPHSRLSAQHDGERRLIHCTGTSPDGSACNVVVAARVAGLIVVTHQGMEAVVERVHSIKCSRCGTNTSIEPTSPLRATA